MARIWRLGKTRKGVRGTSRGLNTMLGGAAKKGAAKSKKVGAAAKPGKKGTTKVGAKGVTAKPGAKGVTAKPGVKGVTAKPGKKGTAKVGAKGVTAKPGVKGVTAKPGAKGLGAKPGAKGLGAKPGAKGLGAKPGAKGLIAKPGAKGLVAKPGAKGLGAKPGAKGVTRKPGVKAPIPAKGIPTRAVTTAAPTRGVSVKAARPGMPAGQISQSASRKITPGTPSVSSRADGKTAIQLYLLRGRKMNSFMKQQIDEDNGGATLLGIFNQRGQKVAVGGALFGAKPKPTLGKPKPTLGKPKPTLGKPKPTLGKPKPTLGKPAPTLGKPAPTLGKPKPAPGRPAPAPGRPAPAPGRPAPAPGRPGVTGSPQGTPYTAVFEGAVDPVTFERTLESDPNIPGEVDVIPKRAPIPPAAASLSAEAAAPAGYTNIATIPSQTAPALVLEPGKPSRLPGPGDYKGLLSSMKYFIYEDPMTGKRTANVLVKTTPQGDYGFFRVTGSDQQIRNGIKAIRGRLATGGIKDLIYDIQQDKADLEGDIKRIDAAILSLQDSSSPNNSPTEKEAKAKLLEAVTKKKAAREAELRETEVRLADFIKKQQEIASNPPK